jgi:Superinfection immunity protein
MNSGAIVASTQQETFFEMTAFLVTCFVLYWLPTIVAVCRGRNSALGIFILNLILGWSGLCWIIALIWSCTGNVRRNNVHVDVVVQAPVVKKLGAPVDWTDHLDDFCAKRFGWR